MYSLRAGLYCAWGANSCNLTAFSSSSSFFSAAVQFVVTGTYNLLRLRELNASVVAAATGAKAEKRCRKGRKDPPSSSATLTSAGLAPADWDVSSEGGIAAEKIEEEENNAGWFLLMQTFAS